MPELGELPGGGQPWGGIVNASLPELQQTEQQMGQMQIFQQRLAQQQKLRQSALYDRMQQQEIAKVRSADAPDVANAFTNWRAAQIASEQYKGRDATQYNQLSNAANQAYATVAQKIQKSSEAKQQLLQMQEDYKAHPDKYADNATDLMHANLDTPVDQLSKATVGGKPVDLSNQGSYLYTDPNFDMNKILKPAIGTPEERYVENKPADDKNVQTLQTPYAYGNSPAQVMTSVYSGLQQHQAARTARAIMANLPPEEIQRVNQAFSNLPQDYWQKATGSPTPQNLEPTNPNDPSSLLASYQAKKYAIENMPQPRPTRSVVNQVNMDAVKKDTGFDIWKMENAITYGERKDILPLEAQWRNLTTTQQQENLDGLIGGKVDKALTTPGSAMRIKDENGWTIMHTMAVSPLDHKIFDIKTQNPSTGKTETVPVDDLAVSSDGKTIKPVYYMRDSDGNIKTDANGVKGIYHEASRPISIEEYKAQYGSNLKNLRSLLPSLPGNQQPPKKTTISVTDLRSKYGY